MKNKLYILTAATPRLAIHSAGLLPFVTLLQQESLWEVEWLVNLDKPEMFSEDELEECKAVFESMGASVVCNTINPSFSLAGRNLYKSCGEKIVLTDIECNENVILWLEDDWAIQCDDAKDFIDNLRKLYTTDREVLLGNLPHRVDGNPVAFKEGLLFEICLIYDKNQEQMIDPEIAMMDGQRRYDSEQRGEAQDLDYHRPPNKGIGFERSLFVDVGRGWRKAKKIGKKSRFSNEKSTWYPEETGITEY